MTGAKESRNLTMNISFKKLLAEDEDFANFLKEVNWIFIQRLPNENLKGFYDMYQAGIDAKQVAELLRRNNT